ncbi:MAG TPA: hypothetical protein VK988_04370 [Acidimicrobiales bacterium]|nr:hypothetical protein [Acidimicrobiales bacterium]
MEKRDNLLLQGAVVTLTLGGGAIIGAAALASHSPWAMPLLVTGAVFVVLGIVFAVAYWRSPEKTAEKTEERPSWEWSKKEDLCHTWIEGEGREPRRIFLIRKDRDLPFGGVCEVVDPFERRWTADFRAASMTLDAVFGVNDDGKELRGRALSVRYPESFKGAPSGPLQLGAYLVRWAQDVYSDGGRKNTPEVVAIGQWRVEDDWS